MRWISLLRMSLPRGYCMISLPSFKRFLEEKPLYYKEIDHQRVHQAYARIKPHLQQPRIIHLVGTNGKGSTGRMIATLLHQSGVRVGHFSSPHIVRFNERIWVEGEESSDDLLEAGHQRLYRLLGASMSEALSYFEYTTLLALVVMERLEVIVLEAGLGGEYDATNVVSKELSVITPIGLDHQAFLGEDIASIATTKLRSIQTKALLAKQPYPEVYTLAKTLAQEHPSIELYAIERERQEIVALGRELGWANYLIDNAHVAVRALELLGLPHRIADLSKVQLFGRFYPYAKNVRMDVGHNLLAVEAICRALKEHYPQGVVLVYNTLDDKPYTAILKQLKPHLKRVEIIAIESERAVALSDLEATLKALEIPFRMFHNIEKYDNYLVFGSFYVVEAFLKQENYLKNQ